MSIVVVYIVVVSGALFGASGPEVEKRPHLVPHIVVQTYLGAEAWGSEGGEEREGRGREGKGGGEGRGGEGRGGEGRRGEGREGVRKVREGGNSHT
jgi:hypothetical protein